MPESLHNFEDIFSKESFDSLPNWHKWDHTIELECDPEPGFHKVYPMMLEEQECNISSTTYVCAYLPRPSGLIGTVT
jgi:hypothetical protein